MPSTGPSDEVRRSQYESTSEASGTTRRTLLKAAGAGVGGLALGSTAGGTAAADEHDAASASVTLSQQTTAGSEIEVDLVETDVDASLFLRNEAGDTIGGSGVTVDAGDSVEGVTVELEDAIAESQVVEAVLFESNAGPIASDSAFVSVEGDDAPATVQFAGQSTDGSSVSIDFLSTVVDASLFVVDESGDQIGGSGVTVDAGETVEDLEVDLETAVEESQVLEVRVYESNAGQIASDEAFVQVGDGEVATLSVSDQTTDGSEVVVDEVRTAVDASVFVFDEAGDEIGGSGVRFDAGATASDLSIDLEQSLSKTQSVEVVLYESNDGPIAEATAAVTVEDSVASVTVSDQTTDGSRILLDEVETAVDATLTVFDAHGNEVDGSNVTFEAGERATDRPVDIVPPIAKSQEVTVVIYELNAGPIAEATAQLTVEEPDTSVTFEPQTTEGQQVVVDSVETDVDVLLNLVDSESLIRSDPQEHTFEAGVSVEDLVVDLQDPLEQSRVLEVSLYNHQRGFVAEESAFVTLESDSPRAEVTVDHQSGDGSAIDVELLASGVDASVFVFDEAGDEITGEDVSLDAGDVREHVSIELSEPIAESQELEVVVYESNGGPIGEDSAFVAVDGSQPLSTLAVPDQTTDGSEIVIEEVQAGVDAEITIFGHDSWGISPEDFSLDAGERRTDLTLDLEREIEHSQEVSVRLYEVDGERIDETTAQLTVEGSSASVSFENQTTDGSQIVVDHVETDRQVLLNVVDRSSEIRSEPTEHTFEAGDSASDLEIDLAEPIEESQVLAVSLYNDEEDFVAREHALVTVEGDEPGTSVEFPPQSATDGEVTLDLVATQVDGSLRLQNEAGDTIGGSGVTFDAGEVVEDVSVELTEPLPESQQVTATLYESNAGPIAEDEAFVEAEGGRPVATLTVSDQTTDGTEVVIDEVAAAVDAELAVFDAAGNGLYSNLLLSGGNSMEDVDIDFTNRVEESQQVRLLLQDEGGAELATATVELTVEYTPPCKEFGDIEACDRDGDGLHRDLTGDGDLTTADVTEFQANLFSDGVQANTEAFNFSGSADGSVSHADVIALFQHVSAI